MPPAMSTAKVSIVIPTYNERENIVPLVREIKQHLGGRAKEIMVVDDNSPDGTAASVEKEFAGDPEVKVIVRRSNRGFANSIREGIEKSSGEVVAVMDSDFNHEPKYLPFMVGALDHYDAVFGSRFLYGGLMAPPFRHKCSWVFNIFVRFATGGDITDNLYGFFTIKRAVLERCEFDDVFWGYGDYCIRLLYFLQKEKTPILQVPIVNGVRRGGVGNSAFLKVLVEYTVATFQLALQGRIRSKHK